jgi:hypothetical protein
LIERAEALAPQRPEFVWLHLAICGRLKCDAKAQIEAHLQALDPGNGFVWAFDLERAELSESDAAVIAIVRIGAGQRMTFYWNQPEVMMVDALLVANPRATDAINLLAAHAIPALQSISKPCRLEQLDLPGRRAACEAMVALMEQSSAALMQSLALSLQERWWPAGSPQGEVVLGKRRRFDYLLTMSGRIRWWRMNRTWLYVLTRHDGPTGKKTSSLRCSSGSACLRSLRGNWKDSLHSG